MNHPQLKMLSLFTGLTMCAAAFAAAPELDQIKRTTIDAAVNGCSSGVLNPMTRDFVAKRQQRGDTRSVETIITTLHQSKIWKDGVEPTTTRLCTCTLQPMIDAINQAETAAAVTEISNGFTQTPAATNPVFMARVDACGNTFIGEMRTLFATPPTEVDNVPGK